MIAGCSKLEEINEKQMFERKLASWLIGVRSVEAMQSPWKGSASSFSWHARGEYFSSLVAGTVTMGGQSVNRGISSLALAPDHLLLLLVIEGEFISSVYGEEHPVRQGDLMFQDASQPCSFRFAREFGAPRACSMRYLILPREMLGLDGNVAQLHGKVVRHGRPLATLLERYLAALLALGSELGEEDNETIGRATVEMLKPLLAPLFAAKEEGALVANSTLCAICAHIEHNLETALSVDSLCRRFALSRSSLYRLFEPLGGIASYIRSRRLVRARQYLLSPALSHLSIIAIARRCGLEANTFTRLFSQAYGVSPRDARTMAIKYRNHPEQLAQAVVLNHSAS